METEKTIVCVFVKLYHILVSFGMDRIQFFVPKNKSFLKTKFYVVNCELCILSSAFGPIHEEFNEDSKLKKQSSSDSLVLTFCFLSYLVLFKILKKKKKYLPHIP